MNINQRLLAYRAFVLLSLALVLVFPYKYLFGLVGAFPAESVNDAHLSSYARDAVCYEKTRDRSLPKLAISESEDLDLDLLLGGYHSLYLDKGSGFVYAMDIPGAGEQNLLEFFARKNLIDSNWYDFQAQAVSYYSECIYPIDKGIAEAYWATKGTSVLHHWAHLYDGALGFGGHSQYGYLVPFVSQFFVADSATDGPSRFVEFSWWVYYLCGLVYFSLLLAIFNKNPFAVLFFGLLKIAVFLKLGAFAILIGPGYHWSRELIFVSVGALAYWIQVSSEKADGFDWIKFGVISAFLFIVLYVLDPIYFVISLSLLFLASILKFRAFVFDLLHRSPLTMSVVAVGVLISFGLLVFLGGATKLQYIYEKLSTLGGSLFALGGSDTTIAVLLFIMACLFCVYSMVVRNLLWLYFSLVSMVSLAYFLITPDRFHFLKYVEYSVPMFISTYIAIRASWLRSKFVISSRVAKPIVAALFALAALGVIQGAIGLSNNYPHGAQLFTRDYSGNKYFSWQSYSVNGRVINIDASDEFIDHLENFPGHVKTDYLLSPYDKHILFLYDRRNGFGNVDFVASLDSQARLDGLIGVLSKPNRSFSVLVDMTLVDFKDVPGIYVGDQPLGPLFLSSNIYRKARLRASRIASFVSAECVEDVNLRSGNWGVFKCEQ